MTKKGVFFVSVQFMCIAFLLISIRMSQNIAFYLLRLLGFIIGVWSIFAIRKTELSIFPELKEGARLIKNGPYRLVRHPMYLSIMLFFLPALLSFNTIIEVGVYFVLSGNLFFKMKYEEIFLEKEFIEYEQYRQKSFYLIPYIY